MTSSRARTLLCTCLFLACALSAHAQGRWRQPYEAGLRALEQRRYDEAVKQLLRAVAADPRQEPNKREEGVYYLDYFPYYYLGIAYLELRDYDNAKVNLDKAGERLSQKFAPALEQYRTRLTSAMNPPPPPVDQRFAQLIRDADAAASARRYRDAISAYDAARAQNAAEYKTQNAQVRRDQAARALALEFTNEGIALMAKSPSQARSRFDEAQRTFPGLPETTEALAKLKANDESYAAAKNGADQDFNAGNFQAAQQKLQDAQRLNPEQYLADNLGARMTTVQERLAAPARGGRGGRGGDVNLTNTPIRGNNLTGGRGGTGTTIIAEPPPVVPPTPPRADVNRMFDEAVRMSKDGQYREAEAGYAAVVKADPNHKAAADALQRSQRFGSLVDDGRAARNKGDAATARARFEEAQKMDGLRFNREGLNVVLKELASPPATLDAARESLRQGLEALLSGDAQRSISILEPRVRQGAAANAANTAALHAYLGVAYATRALSLANGDEQTRLRSGAIEQFRQALSADRTYALSPRIVSPKILTIFEEAKR